MKPCTSRAAYWRKLSRVRKLPYLVTYTIEWGGPMEPCARLMSMQEIADLVGFSDCNESGNHRVYRLSASGVPEPLIVSDDRPLTIKLYDLAWNEVDSATYDDH